MKQKPLDLLAQVEGHKEEKQQAYKGEDSHGSENRQVLLVQ